ncbi:hypothetical protein DFJ73DRAFT_852716 [Zopfochytrium polystomum]|nr:hypothetical protein DFJ73DRAFT_852716 [Zopfochytrium polystomum]
MDATRDEIRRHFGEAGTVVDVKMLWNKPFCFVRFATESAMERALKTLNGSVLRGSAVRVTRARNPRYRPPMPAFSFAPFAAGPGSMFPPFMDPFYDHDAVGDGPDDGGFVGPDDDEDGYMDGAGGPVDFGKAEDAEDEERVKVVLVARSKAAVPAEELEEGEVSDEEAIVLCL